MARPPLAPKVLETLRALHAEQVALNPGNIYELDEENGILYVSTLEADTWWGMYSATILDTVVGCIKDGRTVLHKKKGGELFASTSGPAQP